MPNERITADHIAMARGLASSFCKGRPFIDHDAIEGAALEGLVRAERSFDPVRGANFGTWAYTKVWGAIRDEARRASGNSRSAYREARSGGLNLVREISLAAQVGEEGLMIGDTLADRRDATGARTDFLDVAATLHGMPKRERDVVVAYAAGYQGEEIAADMDVSPSRVSQLRTSALKRLRSSR